jgi:hypothetical protein
MSKVTRCLFDPSYEADVMDSCFRIVEGSPREQQSLKKPKPKPMVKIIEERTEESEEATSGEESDY